MTAALQVTESYELLQWDSVFRHKASQNTLKPDKLTTFVESKKKPANNVYIKKLTLVITLMFLVLFYLVETC